MSQSVQIHLLPSLFQPEELRGGTAVIIDILRASTTMVQALHGGARRILPCGTVEEARTAAAMLPAGEAVLGGERHGLLIEGFDLGNSPREYTPARVAGKTLVFTTTNGTRALRHSMQAARIFVGAFVNLQAMVTALRSSTEPIHLVCAGTDGRLTGEDLLYAGTLASRLLQEWGGSSQEFDIATEMALAFARSHATTADEILRTLRRSLGSKALLELGLDADIRMAATCDLVPVVPFWHAESQSLLPLS